MLTLAGRFNVYFLALCCAAVFGGCKTTAEKREAEEVTVIRFHRESRTDGSPAVARAAFRAGPEVGAEASPVLDERNIESAEIVESEGGFAIQIRFGRHGQMLLDQISTESRNRRLLIWCQWEESRWLAAPMLRGRIPSGYLTFTPDATREETIRIVRGLNNMVKKLKAKDDTW